MNFCLQITFNAIGDVQLMIIVIDKQMTSLNVINAILNKIIMFKEWQIRGQQNSWMNIIL
jgi:hypothetical protein